MNAANLAPAPRSVIERVMEITYDVDGDVSFQNRARLSGLQGNARSAIAEYLGAEPDEIALVRNTSEANNIVIGGLELGVGDEVLLFDQNHATNSVAWDVRGARYGFGVRRVGVPDGVDDPDEVRDAFLNALRPETRVLAFSDISNVSGLRLPVRDICGACRERGVYTHVDGAQSFGAVEVDLHELGCDSYASSSHKWFMGPKEGGVLYVRAERIPEIWPHIVGVGWGSDVEPSAAGARKFETLGQRNDATLVGMGAAVELHYSIGPDRIEARIHELASHLVEGLRGIRGLRLVTPAAQALRAGVVVARVETDAGRRVYERLYEEHGIAGAATGGLRLCPHIYNTREDVERAVEAVARLV